MTLASTNRNQRNSCVELMKLIGIFLIVLTHVIQTLEKENVIYDGIGWSFGYGLTTTDVKTIILYVFRQLGQIGNAIFFTCSAWYFVDKTKNKKEKVAQLFANQWTISVLVCILYLLFSKSIYKQGIYSSNYFLIFMKATGT